MSVIGLCTLCIGMSGALESDKIVVMIVSMVVGTALGTLVGVENGITKLSEKIERKFKKEGEESSIAEGFVTASLVFCVGAMTIVGSLQSGLTGDHSMLITKATLDLVSSLIFAASLGIGVMLAAAFVLVFQGGIVLIAQAAAPFLTDYVIGEMTCVGSILIMALGMNIIGVTNFKVMNYLPAIFIPILLCTFM
jgi:uncharacterized membrane protein YqgA involved in biofilm formation